MKTGKKVPETPKRETGRSARELERSKGGASTPGSTKKLKVKDRATSVPGKKAITMKPSSTKAADSGKKAVSVTRAAGSSTKKLAVKGTTATKAKTGK
jgi:hypothetical protein